MFVNKQHHEVLLLALPSSTSLPGSIYRFTNSGSFLPRMSTVIMELSYLEVSTAFYQAQETWGGLPLVTGIDIGYKSYYKQDQCLAIRIHVAYAKDMLHLKATQPLPSDFNGIPVTVVQGNYQQSLSDDTATETEQIYRRYPVQSSGLGMALRDSLGLPSANGHAIAAKSRLNNAHASDIISLGNKQAANALYRLIETVESRLQVAPKTRAELLFAGPGNDPHKKTFDVLVQDNQDGEETTTVVDGFGLYAVGRGLTRRFIEGFRLLPV